MSAAQQIRTLVEDMQRYAQHRIVCSKCTDCRVGEVLADKMDASVEAAVSALPPAPDGAPAEVAR